MGGAKWSTQRGVDILVPPTFQSSWALQQAKRASDDIRQQAKK